MPVSMTSKRSNPSLPTALTRTTTSPVSVNLMALPTKLISICRSRIGSPRHAHGHVEFDGAGEFQHSWHARARRRSRSFPPPLRAIGNRRAPARSLPASTFEKSRMSLMMCSSASAEREMVSERWRCRGVRSVVCSTSDMPMTPFIGVRISWLMRARNSLFALLARSAASLARLASPIASFRSRLALPRLIVRSSTCCSRNCAVLLQSRVAMPDLRQHLIEAVDERAHFVFGTSLHPQAVILFQGHALHGMRQIDDGSRRSAVAVARRANIAVSTAAAIAASVMRR